MFLCDVIVIELSNFVICSSAMRTYCAKSQCDV